METAARSPTEEKNIESMRLEAIQKLNDMRDQLLNYHKGVMASTLQEPCVKQESTNVNDTSKSELQAEWYKEKQQLQTNLQQALRKNEELAMEIAQFRLQEAQLKRSIDQLKHHQAMAESQVKHHQAAQETQRKQLQMKDTLLANYRSSIRSLENKLISQAKR
ncbi:hypothetical protein AC1031_021172 [Aphanomyces cochlioides]|nr:hypothetical protein AC1031_021172 [Aphanomyces cochlioides]